MIRRCSKQRYGACMRHAILSDFWRRCARLTQCGPELRTDRLTVWSSPDLCLQAMSTSTLCAICTWLLAHTTCQLGSLRFDTVTRSWSHTGSPKPSRGFRSSYGAGAGAGHPIAPSSPSSQTCLGPGIQAWLRVQRGPADPRKRCKIPFQMPSAKCQ